VARILFTYLNCVIEIGHSFCCYRNEALSHKIKHPGEFYMDNVSFPSGLFIIYDLNTEKTGLRSDWNNKHTHTHTHWHAHT